MLQFLVECYTHILTGRSVNDVINNSYDSIKMFESMPKVKLNPGQSLRSKSSMVYKKF